MRWADAKREPPTKPGQYFVDHAIYGKCVYGWDGGWGITKDANVLFWIQNDGREQALDGSFSR